MDDLGMGENDGKHPTELRYPKQTATWKELDKKGYDIHLNKNRDYSPSNILYTGMPGILVRLWDKICRLMNLYNIPFPNFQEILDEGQSHIYDRINLNTIEISHNGCLEEFIHVIKVKDFVESEFFKMNDKSRIDFTKFREREPANESIEDNLSDLSNYAKILHLYYRRVWGR